MKSRRKFIQDLLCRLRSANIGPITGHGMEYCWYLMPFWRDLSYNPVAIRLFTYFKRCHCLDALALPTITSAFEMTFNNEARSCCSISEETILENNVASISFRLSSGEINRYRGSGYDASALIMNCIAWSSVSALK